MLTDITLEVDLAAVCTQKFSSFSMEFDDSTVRAISYYAVLYMNLHESKHNSQRAKLQQMSIL
jgi:hypothetical protein